jgi:hypothetical protein
MLVFCGPYFCGNWDLKEIPIDASEIEYRYGSGTQIYSTLGTWPISCSIAFM